MNKTLGWKILIPLGIVMFIFGGMWQGDIGVIGLFCFVLGLIYLFFPKFANNSRLLNAKSNYLSIIVALIIIILGLFYIWYKLH